MATSHLWEVCVCVCVYVCACVHACVNYQSPPRSSQLGQLKVEIRSRPTCCRPSSHPTPAFRPLLHSLSLSRPSPRLFPHPHSRSTPAIQPPHSCLRPCSHPHPLLCPPLCVRPFSPLCLTYPFTYSHL